MRTARDSKALAQCFSGKERDSETNLDFFEARYFSGAQGRFTSADDPLIDQSPSDPQSWNLYAYVRNNPLKNVDPTGQDCLYTGTYDAKANSMAYERGSCSQEGGTYVAGTIDLSSVKVDTNSNSIDYAYNAYNPTAGGGYSFGSTELPDARFQAVQRGTMLAAPAVGPLFDATMAFVQIATARFLVGPMPEDYGLPKGPQTGAPRTPDPQRPSGVPANWQKVPDTKGKGGFKYADPNNPSYNYVRVRADGTVTQVKNGQALDAMGKAVPHSSTEAHFPISQFVFRP